MKIATTYLLNCLYLCVYALILPVILYRRAFQGRSLGSFPERFLGLAPQSSRPKDKSCRIVWLHAVSVGEVNLLETLLDRLQQQHPNARFVISTTTATGMQLAQQKYSAHPLFFFPIDFSWAIKNALRRIQPDLIVLTELEVWPNLISIATDQKIPVAVINGRLSEKSFRGYKKLQRLVQPTFARLDRVVAQTLEYAERFRQLGCRCDRISIAGSIKFDGATAAPDMILVEKLRQSIGLNEDDVLWVAGSTQEPEEQMAARIWQTLVDRHSQLRLVIVPRHPERGRKIQQQLTDLGVLSVLRSESNQELTPKSVLIADTIGELTAWWSLASIAFVGGSFGDRGGQNMLEPAAMGAAVSFGPNTWNFKQIVEAMQSAGIGTRLDSESDLGKFVDACLSNLQQTALMGAAARKFVIDSQGAADRTCAQLADYFDSSRLATPSSELQGPGHRDKNATDPARDERYRAA